MDGKKIALMGHARSGKDYVAGHLKWTRSFIQYAFADPMKEMAKELFPEEFADGAKPRELLQWFGQKMRERDPDVWVKYTLSRITGLDEVFKDMRFVISDLRQPNEHAALKAAGFAIVKVHASQDTRIRRMEAAGDKFDPKDLKHETEMHIDVLEPDFTLYNDQDDDDVLRQMDDILAGLGVR